MSRQGGEVRGWMGEERADKREWEDSEDDYTAEKGYAFPEGNVKGTLRLETARTARGDRKEKS